MNFELDTRLAADTHIVAHWPLCEVLLMDDAHYPWLILVPRVADAREAIDLDEARRAALYAEIDAAARALKTAFVPDKLNIAALGNVVSQLHVHVIARYVADAAWPKPVWGVHPVERRSEAERAAVIERIQRHLPDLHR